MGWKEWVCFPKCGRLQLEQGGLLVGGRHLREVEVSLGTHRLQGVGHSQVRAFSLPGGSWIPMGTAVS